MRLPALCTAAVALAFSGRAATFTVLSAAGYQPVVAPNSWAVAFGTGLSTARTPATLTPEGQWPTQLAGITVQVDGKTAELYYVSPGQINFLVPDVSDFGFVPVVITNTTSGASQTSTVNLQNIAAAIFTNDESGSGPGAILNGITYAGAPFSVWTPQNPNNDLRTRLAVFGTGFRNAGTANVTAQGTDPSGNHYNFVVEYAGPGPCCLGLDQMNIVLPAQLDGAGVITLTLTAGDSTSNAVTFQMGSIPVSELELANLTLSSSEITGGNTVTGTVSLNGVARAAGFPVSLRSSLVTLQLQPALVTIPQGQVSATFTIQTASTATTQNATISAQSNAGNLTAPLQIDPTTVVQLTNFIVTPASVQGGTALTGTLSLNQNAPLGGVTVLLSSNDSAVQPPAKVPIQVNSSTATFSIPTTAVTAVHNATLSASLGNTTVTAPAIVVPVVQLTLSASSVTGGASLTATVTLGSPAPAGGTTVSVTSNASGVAQVQSGTVAIPAGQTTTQVTIVTFPVTLARTVTITATAGAAGSASATLTVSPQGVGVLQSVSVSPKQISAGSSATGTVTLTAPAGPFGLTVALKSSSASVTVPQTVNIQSGNSSATFNITTTALASGSVTITASAGSVTVTATLTIQ